MADVTRKGAYGGARSPYGSFIGKDPATPNEAAKWSAAFRQQPGIDAMMLALHYRVSIIALDLPGGGNG